MLVRKIHRVQFNFCKKTDLDLGELTKIILYILSKAKNVLILQQSVLCSFVTIIACKKIALIKHHGLFFGISQLLLI